MRWFRFYNEFIYDEKIEFLDFGDQRHFVFLLCMKSLGLLDKDYNNDAAMLDQVVGRRLGLQGEALDAARIRLMRLGFIDEAWQPTNWERYQYESDSSTERVRKFREKHGNALRNGTSNGDETLQKRKSNAVDTEADTDTDTEEAIYVDEGSSTSQSAVKKVVPNCPHQQIVDLYHQILPTCRPVAVMNATRTKHLQQRWREMYAAGEFKTQEEGINAFADYFKFVSASKFLTGRAKTVGDRQPFVADLEWLIRPTNFAKVIEGKYQ